jgi:glycogen operon protein
LHDLVTYNDKHNEANQEGNRDGTDDNRSWNCGVEGETEDPEITKLRRRQQRNFLATLLLSQGVPMLLGGDEMDRTQRGNNNGWCQDSELSWYDWDVGPDGRELREFTRRLIALRRGEPVFRRERFLAGEQPTPGLPDVWWFRLDGRRMTRRDWENPEHRWLGVFLNGSATGARDSYGRPVEGESFLVLFNAHHEHAVFKLPAARFGTRWAVEVTTAAPSVQPGDHEYRARGDCFVTARSITVLRRA